MRGPDLNEQDLAEALPALQRRVLSNQQDSRTGLRNQLQTGNSRVLWSMGRDAVRISLSALLVALGLFGLSRRETSQIGLLEVWLQALQTQRLPWRSARAQTDSSPEPYLRKLRSRQDDHTP